MSRMHLQRLRIEQVRQFRQPYELTDLSPGLNLFTGPNEAGKSTLVRAIRAAFFERHRSTSVEDLQPWGDSSASPSVELHFTLGDTPYHLSKSFLVKKRCDLTVGTKHLEGVEAEDYLANLFGFAFAGKGASRAEHWGVPGLLWVDQGSGQNLDVSHAKSHLQTALQGQVEGGEVSALAATGGDELLRRFQELRAELLTPTGRPKAAYSQALTDAELLEKQLRELEAQILSYQQQVDELARLREQQQADEREKPWEALQQQLDASLAQQSAIKQLAADLAAESARLAQLNQSHSLLMAQVAAFADQERVAQVREQEALKSLQALEQAESTILLSRQQADDANIRLTKARVTLECAQQENTRRLLTEQLNDAKKNADQLAHSLNEAQKVEVTLGQLRREIAQVEVAEKDVVQLDRLDRKAREAEIKRQAVATRLSIDMLPGKHIELEGNSGRQTLSGQAELLIDSALTLRLADFGVMTITPGGEDLAALVREHEDAVQALQLALHTMGVPDIAHAQQRLASFKTLSSQLKLAEQAFKLVAPKGRQDLLAQQDALSGRIQQVQDAIARLPVSHDMPIVEIEQAQSAVRSAETISQSAMDVLNAAERTRAATASRRDQAVKESEVAIAALADPLRLTKMTQAQEALIANQAEQQVLNARIDTLQTDLDLAKPDFIAQDIERLQTSLKSMQDGKQKRHEKILLLQNTLEVAGAQGLDERKQQLAGDWGRATRRVSELHRRAAALDLLCSKLESKRQATLQRLQEPLLQRLKHYLQLIFPGATMEVDENLAPQKILRQKSGAAQEVGDVEDLSFGSREQLGLISRVAYADLLAQAGRPTLLILDDALVHSDEGRLAQMKRVIYDAAQRHQLLLFTCHPNAWRDLGAELRTL